MDPQLPQLSPNQWYMEGRGSGESGLGRCNIYVCIYIYIYIHIYIYMCTCFWCISYVFASMPMTREVCSLPQTRASRSPTRTARSALKNARAARNPSPSGVLRLYRNLRQKGATPPKKEGPISPIIPYIYIYIIYLIFRKILRHVRTACVYIYIYF